MTLFDVTVLHHRHICNSGLAKYFLMQCEHFHEVMKNVCVSSYRYVYRARL
jgi:hypothetical protein